LDHAAAVLDNGDLFTWGFNSDGQCARADPEQNEWVPRRLDQLVGVEIAKIACGQDTTALLTADGELLMWGCNQHGQIGTEPVEPKQIIEEEQQNDESNEEDQPPNESNSTPTKKGKKTQLKKSLNPFMSPH